MNLAGKFIRLRSNQGDYLNRTGTDCEPRISVAGPKEPGTIWWVKALDNGTIALKSTLNGDKGPWLHRPNTDGSEPRVTTWNSAQAWELETHGNEISLKSTLQGDTLPYLHRPAGPGVTTWNFGDWVVEVLNLTTNIDDLSGQNIGIKSGPFGDYLQRTSSNNEPRVSAAGPQDPGTIWLVKAMEDGKIALKSTSSDDTLPWLHRPNTDGSEPRVTTWNLPQTWELETRENVMSLKSTLQGDTFPYLHRPAGPGVTTWNFGDWVAETPLDVPFTNDFKKTLLFGFAPRVYLHSDEKYYPCSVESVISNTRLCVTGNNAHFLNNYKDLSNRIGVFFPKHEQYIYGDKDARYECGAPPPAYSYFIMKDNKIRLVYYFFFAFNSVPGPITSFDHYGDWECFSVDLNLNGRYRITPERARFEAHGDELIRPWNEIEFEDGHPIAFCANGMHGTWPNDGWHRVTDRCNKGKAWNTYQNLCMYDMSMQRDLTTGDKLPKWMERGYIHYWGDPISDATFGSGPTGPIDKGLLTIS